MTTEQENKIIERIEETTITLYNFDLIKNQIIMELKNDFTGEEHKVIFRKVSAFSFAYDSGELNNAEVEEWTPEEYRLELTSISFWNKIRSTLSGADWTPQYKACYNVVIEIWCSSLLINAAEIIVDDEVFQIDNEQNQ